MIRLTIAIALIVFMVPAAGFCQDGGPDPAVSVDWMEMLALLVTFAVVIAVKLLTAVMPTLKRKMGWLIPIVAMIIGPLMAMAGVAISGALGYPVYLSPIAAALAGGTAVAFHQIGRQVKKINE